MAKSNLGAVMIGIVSETRMVLVTDGAYKLPFKKLPGGCIEEGEDVPDAVIREAYEETGIRLLPGEVETILEQRHGEDGTYYPYLCIARVSEERLDSRLEFGQEFASSGRSHPIKTEVFEFEEIKKIYDILKQHKRFISNILSCC